MSPVVSISVVKPVPDRFDEFMEVQLEQYRRLRGKVQGLRGSRCYRALDGRSLILVATFETAEDQQRFAKSAELHDHLRRIRPLVEAAGPALCEVAYEYGEV